MELIHTLADYIFDLLKDLGYLGIMLGLMVEVIPSEIVLAYAGYLVHIKEINFVGAVVFGTIGGVIAQIFVYWIGKYGGRPFLERYGKYLLIQKKHLDISERWFNQYGTGMIFFARFIPVVRHAISIPAGMARMPLWRFTVLTTLAVIPWSIFFVWLGYKLGSNYDNIDSEAKKYVLPIMAVAIALMVIYFLWKLKKGKKHKDPVKEAGAEGEKLTKHQLKFIGQDYEVLHDVVVKSGQGTQQLDHIVVGPNGVFHIDSKHWAGKIRFTEHGIERSHGEHQTDPTAQLYRHEYVMKEALREAKLEGDVVGVICFTHPHAEVSGRSPAFATVKLDRLVHFIRSYKAKKPMTAAQVKEAALAIQRRSTPTKHVR